MTEGSLRSLERGLRVLLWAVLLVAVPWAIAVAVRLVREQGLPAPGISALMLTASTAGTVAAGGAWATFVGTGSRRRLAAGFVNSQLTKYLPGGIWQPAGQIAAARQEGVPLGRASLLFVGFMATFVVAAAVAGPLLAVADLGLPLSLRVLLAALPVAVIALHPSCQRLILKVLPGRVRALGTFLPAPRRVAVAFVGQEAYLLGQGIAFLLSIHALTGKWQPAAVAAYAVAWGAGFLVVPLPAGAGVREAVMVALLAGGTPAAVLIAAAVMQRAIALLGELLAAACFSLLGRAAVPESSMSPPRTVRVPRTEHNMEP